MMKRLLFLLFNFVFVLGLVRAEDESEIKYNFERTQPCQTIMTDGTRHPVLRQNINRIEFSRIDTLGYEHNDYVSQIIYLQSGDSIVLPINDIKSFEFQTPPTVYADGVTVIDRDGLWEHVLESAENSFVLDSSTPSELIPIVGQRLVTVRADGVFPYGFSGEVKSVVRQSDGTSLIDCDFIDYTETILQHVGSFVLHPYTEDSSVEVQSRAPSFTEKKSIKKVFPLEKMLTGYVKQSKLPVEVGLGLKGSFEFIQEFYIDAEYTNIIDYGYNTVVSTWTITDRKTLECSGAFAFEGEVPLLEAKFGKPLEMIFETPYGVEFYIGLEIPIKFDMDIAGVLNYVNEKTEVYSFYHCTNPNIRKEKPISQRTISTKKDIYSNLQSDFNFSIGPELEFGVRNVGYCNMFGTFGLNLCANLSGGIKFNGTDCTPYSDAGTSVTFYDTYNDKCKLEAGLFGEFSAFIEAGVKAKIPDTEYEFKWTPFNWPLITSTGFKPFWTAYKYPEFIMPALDLRNTESGYDRYIYGINTNLVSPVHVGYRIIDDETNDELYTEYSSECYDGDGDGIKNIEFEVPVIASILGRKATIYPLVKPGESEDSWWEKEVLASPGVPIKVEIIPITGESDGVYIYEATVYGTIERYFYLLNSTGHECGFLYSTGDVDSSSPKVKCTLGTKDISAKLSNLKPGTKYYYAAYVKIEDKYIIGKVKNFTTREDEFVDLGLSVKWCFKNVGAQNETDYGNLYAWGETLTKPSYVWDNYFDSPYDSEGNVVGCGNKTDDIAGDKEYDVVTSTMPGTRMPTKDEMRELIDQCDWNWTTVNGVSGYRITSKVNSNSIFLPAAGIQDGSSCENKGTYGGYWTGTVGSSSTKMTAVNLYFTSQTKSTQQGNRYVGRSIRAVMP